MFEDIVVYEMGRLGITAVTCHTYVKDMDKAKRDVIVAAVRASGADAVITARAVTVGDMNVTQKGSPGFVYGTAADGYRSLPSASSYLRANLQTNLYDAETAELVWTATISTFYADNEARVSRELVRFNIERLRCDGFL